MYRIWRTDDGIDALIGYADDQVEAALIIEGDREGHPDADYRFEEEKANGRGRAESQG